MSNIWKQIKLARKALLEQKQCTPYIFPEYQYMMDCKVRWKEAEKEYLLALDRWNKLGN